jgi:hypothetical protein
MRRCLRRFHQQLRSYLLTHAAPPPTSVGQGPSLATERCPRTLPSGPTVEGRAIRRDNAGACAAAHAWSVAAARPIEAATVGQPLGERRQRGNSIVILLARDRAASRRHGGRELLSLCGEPHQR